MKHSIFDYSYNKVHNYSDRLLQLDHSILSTRQQNRHYRKQIRCIKRVYWLSCCYIFHHSPFKFCTLNMLKFNEILDFKKNRSFKLPVLFGNNSETSINHHWNPKVTHKLFEAFFEIVTVCSLVYNKIPVILLLMKKYTYHFL